MSAIAKPQAPLALSTSARSRPTVARLAPTARRGQLLRAGASSGRGAPAPMDTEQHAKLNPQLMAEEARWENGFREGRVRNVSAKDAAALMKEDGWVVLDVRPSTEIKKAKIVGAVEVPIFKPDTASDLGSLLKQMSAFGMGGWWLGGTHMVPNPSFLAEVQAKVPKDKKVIVGCQKGLRSLAACEQLARAGYPQVAWINGGFDSSRGDLQTEGNVDIRFAGIGGLSEVLGWTEVQQESKQGPGAFTSIIVVAGAILILDLVLFGYEQVQYLQQQ